MTDTILPGTYRVKNREDTINAAIMNGHSQTWPDSLAVSDGENVRFLRHGKKVWECNAHYFKEHFDIIGYCFDYDPENTDVGYMEERRKKMKKAE